MEKNASLKRTAHATVKTLGFVIFDGNFEIQRHEEEPLCNPMLRPPLAGEILPLLLEEQPSKASLPVVPSGAHPIEKVSYRLRCGFSPSLARARPDRFVPVSETNCAHGVFFCVHR